MVMILAGGLLANSAHACRTTRRSLRKARLVFVGLLGIVTRNRADRQTQAVTAVRVRRLPGIRPLF